MANRAFTCAISLLVLHGLLLPAATPESEELVRQGNAAFKKGDRPAAIEFFTQATRVDPSNHVAFLNRGRIRENEGQYEEAVPDFSAVIRLSPRDARATQLRGACLLRLGRTEEALADFDRYLQLEPKQARHHWQRGIALYLLGKYDEGTKQFVECHGVNTNDVEHVLWHFACVARKSGVQQARNSLLTFGNDPRAGMREVWGFYAGKADTNAVFKGVQSGKSIDLERRKGLVHFYLGLFFEASGQSELGRDYIKQAGEIAPAGDFIGTLAKNWRIQSDTHSGRQREKESGGSGP